MKKILASVLALTIVFGGAAVLPEGTISTFRTSITVSAEDLQTEGLFQYYIDTETDSAVLSKFLPKTDSSNYSAVAVVDIPAEIGGKPVTKLGEKLFMNYKELTSVTIPDTVEVIDEDAFYGCSNLQTVDFGANVTAIEFMAFAGCTKLKNYDLPANIEKLGTKCFQNTAVESITIPLSLKTVETSYLSLDAGPFDGCENLKTVKFNDGDYELPMALLAGSGVESVVLPDMITVVPDYFFANCKKLTSVTIPSSVTTINNSAFRYCESLTQIDLPKSLTKLETYAFSESGLTSVTIPKSIEVAEVGFLNAEKGPFYNCPSLTDVTIENGITVIPNGLLAGLSAMKQITIPKTVVTIGEGAFRSTGLTSIEIPNSVTEISTYAFADCTGLTSAKLSKNLKVLGASSFESTGITEIDIPKSLESVDCALLSNEGPFSKCGSLKTVNIPDGAVEVVNNLLAFAPAVEEVNLPDTVVKISDHAFDNCTALKKVNFGSSIEEIGEYAFAECAALTNIDIPKTVTTIGTGAFKKSALTKAVLPAYLKEVPNSIYEGCTQLTEVTVSESCKTVGNKAFEGCTALTKVNFSDKEIIEKIGSYTFKDCTALTEMTLPMGIEKMGSSVFEGCESLEKAVLPDSLTEMGDACFKNCPKLTDVTLSRRLEVVPNETFRYDQVLKEIKIPYSVKKIGNNVFGECISLKDIYVGDNVEVISETAFSYFDENLDGETITLHGVKGTYPEDYAEVHEMKFVATDIKDDTLGDYVRPEYVEPKDPGERKMGDINGDGKVNVTDITKVAAFIKGKRKLDADAFKLADINKDGKVNVSDLARIAAAVKGLRPLE